MGYEDRLNEAMELLVEDETAHPHIVDHDHEISTLTYALLMVRLKGKDREDQENVTNAAKAFVIAAFHLGYLAGCEEN